MAYFNKIALLILNKESTKFLVCEKDPNDVTADYLLPGGQFHEKTEEECLKNEIKEELDCNVDVNSLEFIGGYTDIAAGMPDKDVYVKLYKGKIIGNPKPSSEIKFIHWISKEDQTNPKVSPLIRNKLIPDLLKRGILK